MTFLLEQILQRVRLLPVAHQDFIAWMIEEELEEEERWQRSFAEHPEVLQSLGDEAAAEDAAGLTVPMDDAEWERLLADEPNDPQDSG